MGKRVFWAIPFRNETMITHFLVSTHIWVIVYSFLSKRYRMDRSRDYVEAFATIIAADPCVVGGLDLEALRLRVWRSRSARSTLAESNSIVNELRLILHGSLIQLLGDSRLVRGLC